MNEQQARELTVMNQPQLPQEYSIAEVAARVNKVRQLHKELMVQDIHYGVIPGTKKPTLLKPGAELILMTFMLDPQYEHEIRPIPDRPGHREVFSKCVLYHIPTNRRVGSGGGSCSTMESKYRWRYQSAGCPECGHELMRSKYGEKGWYCNSNRGGCGANFKKTDPRIGSGGKVENPDIADQWNTVLKMADKRALIASVLNATAASEAYTQDVEDFAGPEAEPGPEPEPEPEPQPKPQPERKVELKPDKPAAPAKPTGVIANGQINLLLGCMRNAGMIPAVGGTDKGEIIKAAGFVAEWLHVEVQWDEDKPAADNLVAMLRKVAASQVTALRDAILAKKDEEVVEV